MAVLIEEPQILQILQRIEAAVSCNDPNNTWCICYKEFRKAAKIDSQHSLMWEDMLRVTKNQQPQCLLISPQGHRILGVTAEQFRNIRAGWQLYRQNKLIDVVKDAIPALDSMTFGGPITLKQRLLYGDVACSLLDDEFRAAYMLGPPIDERQRGSLMQYQERLGARLQLPRAVVPAGGDASVSVFGVSAARLFSLIHIQVLKSIRKIVFSDQSISAFSLGYPELSADIAAILEELRRTTDEEINLLSEGRFEKLESLDEEGYRRVFDLCSASLSIPPALTTQKTYLRGVSHEYLTAIRNMTDIIAHGAMQGDSVSEREQIVCDYTLHGYNAHNSAEEPKQFRDWLKDESVYLCAIADSLDDVSGAHMSI